MKKNLFYVLVSVKLAVTVFIFGPAAMAMAADWSFDLVPKIAKCTFAEKASMKEFAMEKYPGLLKDALAVIEKKYPDAPKTLHEKIHQAVTGGDHAANLRTARELLAMMKKEYPKALSKFAEALANEVLKPNPGIVDELLKKGVEVRKASFAGLAGKADPKTIKEKISDLIHGKHAEKIAALKNAAAAGAAKVDKTRAAAFVAAMKALAAERYPDLDKVRDALMAEYKEMKKPAATLVAILKNPDFMVAAAKLIEEYRDDIFAFADGALASLIESKTDFFETKSEIKKTVLENAGVSIFELARIRIDGARAMHEFVNSKYPGLARKVAKAADASWPAIAKNAIATVEKQRPGIFEKAIAAVRSECPELESDINAMLRAKHPKALDEILEAGAR